MKLIIFKLQQVISLNDLALPALGYSDYHSQIHLSGTRRILFILKAFIMPPRDSELDILDKF